MSQLTLSMAQGNQKPHKSEDMSLGAQKVADVKDGKGCSRMNKHIWDPLLNSLMIKDTTFFLQHSWLIALDNLGQVNNSSYKPEMHPQSLNNIIIIFFSYYKCSQDLTSKQSSSVPTNEATWRPSFPTEFLKELSMPWPLIDFQGLACQWDKTITSQTPWSLHSLVLWFPESLAGLQENSFTFIYSCLQD